MTRKSKEEIVLFYATVCRVNRLRWGTFPTTIYAYAIFISVSEVPHACHVHPDAEIALSFAAETGCPGMLHHEVAVPVGQWWNLC